MIPAKLCDAMNDQIKHEMESYYIYLSMVAYFHEQGLDGMAHWMRCQSHEEMVHAMKLFDHIIDRGGRVVLQDLKQLKTEWASPLEAWKDALEHERFITGKINELQQICRHENDFTAEPILAWFSKEQIEEESNAEKNVTQMEMVGENKQGALMLDREMGARPFPAGSPFDPAAYAAQA